ncbi:MAG: S6e family ribosomal protein [Nitrososphaerota archaeon]
MSKQAVASPRLVISNPRGGKASTMQLTPQQFALFLGKRVGDQLDGDAMGLKGSYIKITGGTDRDGFPMRRDVSGGRKVGVLLTGPPGFHPREKPPSKKKKRRNRRTVKGLRKRVTVRGDTISDAIAQINVVLIPKEVQKA